MTKKGEKASKEQRAALEHQLDAPSGQGSEKLRGIRYLKVTPPKGTPDWDAYPDADAEFYEIVVQSTPEEWKKARISERALWQADRRQYGRWYVALEELDKQGDKGRLLKLLRTEAPLPATARDTVRESLACMLDRHQFKMGRRINTESRDKLISAMLTEEPLSGSARASFIDLLERYVLVSRPGNPARPLYERTLAEWERQLECEHVEMLIRKGMNRDKAIAFVVDKRKFRDERSRSTHEERLRTDLAGSSGWKRRLAKLRKRIRPRVS